MRPDFEGHANQFLLPMLTRVLEEGHEASPRGRKTKELLHVVTMLPDPRKRVLTVSNRRANPFFQIAETVWILAGASDAEWICHFNSQLHQYLDQPEPGQEWLRETIAKHFHAPYGERMRHYGRSAKLGLNLGAVDQLANCIQELRDDPETRRAVMVFHHPWFDRPSVRTLDRPCNVAFTFKLREGKLHMATFNRSNDVVLGLTFTNLVQFTTIQEVVAASLGVELGPYVHFSDSLHVYEDDAVAARLSLGQHFDVYDYVSPAPMESGEQALRAPAALYRPLGSRCPDEYISCPYWQTAGCMIQAWDVLKAAGPDAKFAALRLLASCRAEDWKIAGLEFLYRWVRARGDDTPSFARELDRVLAYYPAPVAEWVRHSAATP